MFQKDPYEKIKMKCEQVFKARYQIYDDDVIYNAILSISLQYNKSKDRIQNFNAWLNGAIHHNFCIYINQKEASKLDFKDTTETDFVQEEEDELTKIRKQEVFNQIMKLKSPAKEILEMKIYQEKGYTEIASALNIKESTIRKHVSRAIQLISKKLTVSVTIFAFTLLSVIERVL